MPESTFKHFAPAVAIKADELPEDVAKAAEGKDIDKWFYATVEAEDREGDVVRVKGLNTTKYAQSGGPIKVLIQHNKGMTASGRLPIVGGVAQWAETKHKATGLPAMAAGIKFVDTDLGREMKTLADAGLLDVSIGFEPLESTPRGKGFDFTRAAVSELSVCTMGMNQYAGAVKAEADARVDDILKPLTEKVAELTKQTNELLALVDDTKCAIVVKAKEAADQPDDHSDSASTEKSNVEPATPDDVLNRLAELLRRK